MTFTKPLHSTLLLIAAVALIFQGCASSTRNLDPQQETYYDASYDFSDKKRIVEDLVTNILDAPFAKESEKPLFIIYPFSNETSEHINTGGISDDIQRKMLQSGKFRFINERQRTTIQKEIAYQKKGYIDESMKIQVGRQLGADFLLSGSLRSIKKKQPKQWRVQKKERIYYSLDLTVTNLVTNEVIYMDQAEIAREASRPVIGW